MKAKSYAVTSPDAPVDLYELERREPGKHDVEIRILYSGICHSDIHTARGDWGEIEYPCVPGHEIMGTVTRVGEGVTDFKPGDTVGVGVIVNSCQDCAACKSDYEQYCENGPTYTYSSKDPIDRTTTQGGYSDLIVTQEKFVVHVPESLDISKAAPLLCAGITMYSPLRHWNAGPGKKVGIIGLGGLGHMGVKYAKAMGAEVYVITSSPQKAEDAKKFGADGVIVSSDKDEMKRHSRFFDLLIDTIPVEHDLYPYLALLNLNSTIVLVGPINPMPGFHGGDLIDGRKAIAGSGIGSMKEVREMLEFSAEHQILPEVETVRMQDINEAWKKMQDGAMSHRFVIDVAASF
ncbi:MAG: NADP-dependent alcohol dehydrogenase C [candidate division WS6 bacterium OLB20]|uniref:NADP-dependent alcohol dehydrogenase C n=1 Tax=candidate division WS6 bacterium OLB20 TaxID=1617426 RepID=A0A136M0D0_9BACT|nr:MAG: NADP-dependent alcohol dehydrogenase C [candidate division WS6 bacterium OLB20]